ncbi:unnamed protein product, partial [Arabidopsis halleri]
TIYEFARVLPTIFVKLRNINGEMESGVLVEFREIVNHIDDYIQDEDNPRIIMDEVHKISLVDVRFGNMDRNEKNIFVTIEEKILHLIPIDHEMCFVNAGQNYNMRCPYWLGLK